MQAANISTLKFLKMLRLLQNKKFLIVILLGIGHLSFSQNLEKDFDLIKSQKEPLLTAKRYPAFMLPATDNVIIKYNPVSMVFSSSMFFYQKFLSQQFHAECLYNPSCSEFSKELIKTHGLILGVIYSTDRLMRCNRIAAMDIPQIKVDEETHKVHESPFMYKRKKK